ncbi:hypothetical protein [Micromonospora wenchangensis]|uniref:hypothetical protein n=1 Tax=Micromonospora wenchangensis TaxID=1185415 RepID=UPI003805386A
MALPRTYTSDVMTDAVRQVEAARAAGRRGPISAVARELHLDRRLLQSWVTNARAHATAASSTHTGVDPVLLPDGLLHCRFCRHQMTAVFTWAGLVYDCPPPCRRPVLNATAVASAVGLVVLRHAAHLVPALTHPKAASIAAGHAHRLITRITAGSHPSDLRITWPTTYPPRPVPPGHLHLARNLATTDPQRARTVLRNILAGIDPTTAQPRHQGGPVGSGEVLRGQRAAAVVPTPSLTSHEAFDSGVLLGAGPASRLLDHGRQAYLPLDASKRWPTCRRWACCESGGGMILSC